MLCRHRKDVLHEERVQLDDLPEQDELEDGDETHPAAARIQPPARSPTLGCKLLGKIYRTFNCAQSSLAWLGYYKRRWLQIFLNK